MIRFLTGLTTGLAIAYLTAPQPGKQTRDGLVGFAKTEAEGVKIIKDAVVHLQEATKESNV